VTITPEDHFHDKPHVFGFPFHAAAWTVPVGIHIIVWAIVLFGVACTVLRGVRSQILDTEISIRILRKVDFPAIAMSRPARRVRTVALDAPTDVMRRLVSRKQRYADDDYRRGLAHFRHDAAPCIVH